MMEQTRERTGAASDRLAADIRALAAIERPPGSPGEEASARWVQSRLGELGLAAEIETFHYNPDYWAIWGAHGLASAAAAGLALLGRRPARLGALLGGVTAASFWGDLTTEFRPLRRLWGARASSNVVARLPNPRAPRVLIVSAHHDAARGGLVFHPAVFRTAARLVGPSPEPPSALRIPFGVMLAVTAGAALRTLGLSVRLTRRPLVLGGVLSLVFAALMRDIGRAPVSPGANDDASGVAVLLALAETLVRAPPANLEVWFVATGSEEGIMGGMEAFLERHAGELEGRRPFNLNIEGTGAGRTLYLEGEGFLRRYPYHDAALALARAVASESEFADVRSLRLAPFGTDALIPTRYGIPAVTVASINDDGYVPHYHWTTDTPDNLDMTSVERAYRFCHRLIERLAE